MDDSFFATAASSIATQMDCCESDSVMISIGHVLNSVIRPLTLDYFLVNENNTTQQKTAINTGVST